MFHDLDDFIFRKDLSQWALISDIYTRRYLLGENNYMLPEISEDIKCYDKLTNVWQLTRFD